MCTRNQSRTINCTTRPHTLKDSWHSILQQSLTLTVGKHAAVKVSTAQPTIIVQITCRVLQQIMAPTVLQPQPTSVHTEHRHR